MNEMKKRFLDHFIESLKDLLAQKQARAMLFVATFVVAALCLAGRHISLALGSPAMPVKFIVAIPLLNIMLFASLVIIEASIRMRDQGD